MARHLAAGPRMDGFGYGAGLGPGSAHHRPVGRGLWRGRTCRLDVRAVRGFPPALGETQQAELKEAVQELPEAADIGLANWNWKVVHQFVSERFDLSLSRSGCLNYLHRLGFVLKRPKKRLVKADKRKRESFVTEYAALTEEVRRFGAKIFFADEAHFRADAGLRGKWVLRGEPALVDLTSPRYGEKASYYSAVCLETGEVEWMELEGNSNSGTSAAFLEQLRERHSGQLNVIWDNAPAPPREAQEWRGSAGISQDARTLELRLVPPRFHEGRLCRTTARTSTGMRRSGAGRGRRPPAICAWEAGPRCRRGSAASSPVWPAGAARSNGAAGRCCNRGPKRSCPIPAVRQMHIPPWLWFRFC